MRRGPRNPDEAILSSTFLRSIAAYGALLTASTLSAYLWGLANAPERATTIAFMTLALTQILHLGNARSGRPVVQPSRIVANRWALAAVALSIALQVATLYLDPLPRLLRVTPLSNIEWLVVLSAAAVPAIVGQVMKQRSPHQRGRIELAPPR